MFCGQAGGSDKRWLRLVGSAVGEKGGVLTERKNNFIER